MLAPTLIVGLGGTGSKVVSMVARKTNTKQRKHVRFVCIDTDVNDLRKLREQNPSIVTIQTSAPYSVGEYLNNNHYARDVWFPTHHILNAKTPTEGAGQVRAISRLAFDTCVKEGAMAPLEKAIEELYPLNGDAVQQALRVIVVSSLAGGTGSGVILPCALYIKAFLEKHLKRSASVMRGFLMLPDIFFGGKSPEEISNLCCNGYAALRELDAFMRRSDGEQSNLFQDLTLKMPDPSTDEYVDYKLQPFNFCFLFGAQNTADQQLGSFQEYMEQAANIVYAQSISALSGRSNSSEDNTILTLCAGHGHNRFCGAGSSRMVYPKNDVIRYIADCWAEKSMDEQWMAFDKQYQEYCNRQEKVMERDPNADKQSLGDFYVDTIMSSKENHLANYIRQQCCHASENDPTVEVGRWEDYVTALGNKITEELENCVDMRNDLGELKSTYEDLQCETNPQDLDGKKVEAYGQTKEFGKKAAAYARQLSSNIINTHILLEKDLTDTMEHSHLEYWLRNSKNEFMHPNALRFFLYGLRTHLQDTIENTRIALKNAEDKQKALDNNLDDQSTEDIRETINDFNTTRRILVFDRVRKSAVEELVELFNQYNSDTKEAFDQKVRLDVLESLIEHVNKMISNVELFYTTLRTCLEQTERERQGLRLRYQNGDGHATYYVCADERCLDALEKEMPCVTSNQDGEIGQVIYREIKRMSLSNALSTSKNLQEMYEHQIMDYWVRSVEKRYAAKLDVGVIDALMNEAVYLSGNPDMDQTEREQYCKDRLLVTARMAEPFIEKPQGEIRHPIAACCYSKETDKRYHDFIVRTLSDEGGAPDAEIDDTEIIFYHAIYGVCAVDLQQFSPEVDNRTFRRRAGIYYSAYKKRVRGIGPVLSKNDTITPHIDRNWHLAVYMPDLSDEIHRQEIKDTYRAMVWGLVSGTIKYSLGEMQYIPESNDNRDFIVPSPEGDAAKDNPCDKLSELSAALAVNPPQVDHVLKSLDSQIALENRERRKFGETLLAKRLKWADAKVLGIKEENRGSLFRVDEFDSEHDASLFDLLYWSRYSTASDEYNVENMNLLRDAIIELVEYYVDHFVEEAYRNQACMMVLLDQLKVFKANLALTGTMTNDEPLPSMRILDDSLSMVTSALSRRFREEYQIDSPELKTIIDEIDEEIKKIRKERAKNPFSV